jgi:hypothetical protein
MSYPPPPHDPNQPQGGYPPPPGQPGQPAYPMQAPPKKKNTKLVLGIVGGFLALCCGGGAIAAIAGGDDKTATTTAAEPTTGANTATGEAPTAKAPAVKATQAAPPADTSPGLNDKVRDGKFEFTVTKVSCGRTQVGGQYLNQKAQGVFCLVDLTVKNIGKEAQMFSGSTQKAFTADGTEFSNDTGAEIYANEQAQTFLNEINPGNQVKGKLVFDVPPKTKLTELELHDSLFSGGVRVKLA